MRLSVSFTNISRIICGLYELPNKHYWNVIFFNSGSFFFPSSQYFPSCFMSLMHLHSLPLVHSYKPFSLRVITIQYNVCARAYEWVCVCVYIHVIQGVQTCPPSHFHYGQISGLCYSSVAFCWQAGSLITHTALLHFHFLFIQPPFHSGFIILSSELSSPPDCLQPVEMT